MTPVGDAPPLDLAVRRIGTRPHALVRRLTWATIGLLTSSFAALLVLSSLYPVQSSAPSWATLAVGFGLLASVGTAAAALLAQVACWIGPLVGGRLAAGPEGIRATGARTRLIARDDIEGAWIVREPVGASVELRLRNGDVFSATTATQAEATAVLDAAGVDATRRALRMPLGSAAANIGLGLAAAFPAACASSVIAGLLGVALHPPSAAVGFLVFTLFVAFVVLAVQRLAPPPVAVGTDGVAVGVGRGAWFAAFHDIAGVTSGRGAITLILRDGRRRNISTLGTADERREALSARIAAGLDAARGSSDLSARLGALDRQGRAAAEWADSLRRLAAARDDYRQTVLTRDEVQAALEDPRTDPERRIGAAFALAAMDSDLAGARVRVVVETVAQEPVRLALEQAAAGELDDDVIASLGDERARG